MRYWVIGLVLVCLQVTTAAAEELRGTLKRIDESGVINLGFREAEPPMSFLDPDGKAIGYSIDLCDHIATAVKKTLGRTDIAVAYQAGHGGDPLLGHRVRRDRHPLRRHDQDPGPGRAGRLTPNSPS